MFRALAWLLIAALLFSALPLAICLIVLASLAVADPTAAALHRRTEPHHQPVVLRALVLLRAPPSFATA